MITNVPEIDLDAFFGPDSHFPNDLPQNNGPAYISDLDIDQAINSALAEIDESSKNIRMPYQNTTQPQPQPQPQQWNSEPSSISNTPYTTQSCFDKALSPASLTSDDSVGHSPQLSASEYELMKLKEMYEQKCKDFERAMEELKKSEIKRFELKMENKQLKEAVVQLSMNC